MKKPTQVQIDARRTSMEKLLDGPGGEEALQDALAGWLDGDKLFFILKAWEKANTDANTVVDFYDGIKTFCELDLDIDNNPWRLVRYDEVLDPDKHINVEDKDAVIGAAESLGLKVFTDETDMKESFDGVMIDADEPFPFSKLMETCDIDDEVYKVIADTNNDPSDPLVVWLEIYGWELRRRERRVG